MNLKNILWLLAGATLSLLLVYLFNNYSDKETGNMPYVSMSILYEESDISKKFKQDLNQVEQASNAKLIELQKELKQAKQSGIATVDLDKLQQQLLNMQEKLSAEYQEKSEAFDKIIWDKLNNKIIEYGKKNQLDYIFGAKGDGSIMYASDSKDITNELIEFINK